MKQFINSTDVKGNKSVKPLFKKKKSKAIYSWGIQQAVVVYK